MTWRDQLRPASFRGVAFFVQRHSVAVGRRVIHHVFFDRDLPFAEDIGRRARRYRVEAFVIGDDYMAQRDALVRACEQQGAGQLIHPWLGELTVRALRCELSEDDKEGGLARLFMKFLEAGESSFPDAQPDTRAKVEEEAEVASAAAQEEFAEAFSVADQTQAVVDAATGQIDKYLTDAEDLLRRAAQPVDRVGEYARQALDLRARLTILVATPVALADRLADAVSVFRASVEDPAEILEPLERLADYGDSLPAVPLTTAAREAQAANQAATVSLLRRSAVIELARAASSAVVESADQLFALRDRTVERLDAEILAAGDAGEDGTFRALQDLMGRLVDDLNSRALQLPRLKTITLARTEPALVTAYRLYGPESDVASRAAEIVARNNVPHPGFLPGGVELLILER